MAWRAIREAREKQRCPGLLQLSVASWRGQNLLYGVAAGERARGRWSRFARSSCVAWPPGSRGCEGFADAGEGEVPPTVSSGGHDTRGDDARPHRSEAHREDGGTD